MSGTLTFDEVCLTATTTKRRFAIENCESKYKSERKRQVGFIGSLKADGCTTLS